MQLIHSQNNDKQQIWVSAEDYGYGKCWEFHVHGLYDSGDLRTCPSIGMACGLIGADPREIIDIYPTLADDGPISKQ